MIDYNTPTFYNDGYDDDGGDIRKVEHHLRQSLENISNIFDVRITISFSHSCLVCALGNKKIKHECNEKCNMTYKAPDIKLLSSLRSYLRKSGQVEAKR